MKGIIRSTLEGRKVEFDMPLLSTRSVPQFSALYYIIFIVMFFSNLFRLFWTDTRTHRELSSCPLPFSSIVFFINKIL